MKRFLIIFGICFASVVVFFGGYLGIKYLKGDFNPEVILPENIAFEQAEYYLEDGQNATMLITTTTENVTETQVSLILSKNCKETNDKQHWTDGIIVIPKTANIGEPFPVTLVKDDVYSDELLNDPALTNWVTGGISTIIATSKNTIAEPATTTAYVDVPVYKTELVIYNGSVSDTTFDDSFGLAEFTSLASLASTDSEISNISAGEKFYVGLKYYPSASAIKYSKVTSTNMLVEYKTQILNRLNLLGLSDLYNDLTELFEAEDASGSATVDFNTIISAYKTIVSNSGNAELNEYITNLSENYYKNLKYFNITEKTVGTENKVILNGRVAGTNIYEYVATQDLGKVDFYTYSFKKSGTEDITFALMNDGDDILQVLESAYQQNNVIKNTSSLNIVDVEVDTMELNGSVSDLGPDVVHTIYASKYGVNSKTESYLNLKLSNSSIPDVNLQASIVNVGIRFEMKQGVNWVDASEIIKFKDAQNYTTIIYGEKTYYLPYGAANYWEVYANQYVDGVFRLVVKYLTEDKTNPGSYVSTVEIAEDKLPQFSLTPIEENMVSWLNVEKQTLKVINLVGALNSQGEAVTVTTNQEYNLANNVNRETLNQNTYTTIKYFIYSDDETYKLSEYFQTENSEPIEYIFNDGSVKQLYELSSSILKLKDINKVPPVSVKAIFVTIKTDINGTPLKDGENYQVVKYSAVKDNLLEKLSAKEFIFETSLSTLSGEISIADDINAGVIDGKLLVAQNASNILSVAVKCEAVDEDIFEEAINNGEISVVAKSKIAASDNYITLNGGLLTAGKMTYDISTTAVKQNTEVSLYVVYTVGGNSYLFPVTFVYNNPDTGEELTLSKLTIVANVNSSAKFIIYNANGEEIDASTIAYIEVTTEYQTQIEQIYTIYFKDETIDPIRIASDQIFDNNILMVSVKNFLNKNGTDEWSLTSDNAKVATVNIEDKKTIDFIGNGDAVISLYLDGNAQVQDTLMFRIANDGYVSQYATYDNDGNKISTFSDSDPYASETIILSVNGDGGIVTLQDTTQTDINFNTALFAMWYMLGDEATDNKKLSFKIRIADEESKEVFNAIVINSQKLGEDEYYLGSSFTMGKTLGRTVVLHLVYECNELGNISQKIILNILWKTSVVSFDVTDEIDTEVKEVKENEYDVYAGYGYKFATEISNGRTAYYYVLNKNSEVVAIDGTSDYIKKVSGLFYFDDVSGKKTYQVYISDVASVPTIGDLQHAIVFNVSTNIKAKENVINAGYRYSISLNTNGKASINFTELFERRIGGQAFKDTFKIVSAGTGITLTATGLDVTFSGVNVIVNSTTVRVTLSYAGYTLNEVVITVTPYNYEMASGERLAKYNNEKAIILVVGDLVGAGSMPNIISTQLSGIVSLDNEAGFSSEYVADEKITAPANSLFTDTNCYAIVKDNAGNQVKYKLIISQLPYPLVNFNFVGEHTAKELDVYKLFITLGKEDLSAYYDQFGAYVGEEYFGGAVINLVKENAGDTAIFNIENSSKVSFGLLSLVQNGDASDYATIDGITLTTYEVGKEFVSLHVILRYTNGRYTYNIPTIVKVNQSQKLKVSYPYDGTIVEDIVGYGTDAYDSEHMVETTTSFSNAIMEYVGFVNGTAKLELTSERFAVYKKVDAVYELDSDYNAGFEFSLQKVYVCLNSVWSEITSENMSSYVIISGNIITFARGGADAIRAKVLVETKDGKAENYYYIQAGQLENFNLYKHDGVTETTVNYQDTINVNTGTIIAINNTSVADYKYYTKTNSDKLNFEIVGNADLVDVNYANKTIEVLRSPNASQVQVKIFTIYGEIAVVNVNINAYYIASLKGNSVYSGTGLALSEFVTIKDILTNDVTNKAKLIDSSAVATEEYVVEHVNNIIKFEHGKDAYVIPEFACYVEIDGYTFLVKITDLEVLPSVVGNFSQSEVKVLEKQTENGGQVTLSKDVWTTLFTFNNFDKVYGVSYQIVYNANVVTANVDENISVDVGILTGDSSIDFEFQVILTNWDSSKIVITSYAKMEVKPQYTAIVNYPQGIDTAFECEYIQAGSAVDFTANNFNGIKRIALVETATGNDISYTLKLKERNGAEIPGFSASGYQFKNEGSYEIDILYNDKLYGRYFVEVIGQNPIGVDVSNVDGQILYAGYGAEDLFNYVDIVLSLPSNMGLIAHEQQFDIVAQLEDGSYEALISGLYYNKNETNLTYRLAVLLEKFNMGVKENNIFVQYQSGDDIVNVQCVNVSISPRITVTYYGSAVRADAYANIVGISGTSIIDLGDGRFSYSIGYTADIVADKANSENKISGEYFVECDIDLTKETVDGIDLTLNANEYPEGLSFVNLFDVRDQFGKTLWYNHIGNLSGVEAKISLSYKSMDTSVSNPVRIEVITKEKDSGHYAYDFMLKAEGAKNNGSIITLTFKYQVGEVSYEQDIVIKVISDVVVSILNGDGTATPNSESNPLTLSNENVSKTLIIGSQTSGLNDRYHIWVYSKYDDAKLNVAQTLNYTMTNAGSYAEVVSSGNDLIFTYAKQPSFGDKIIIITFKDNFGYTFTYHITLVAENRIVNVDVTQDSYFEGSAINVYNKNDPINAQTKGISLDVRDVNDDVITTGIVLQSVTVRDISISEIIDESVLAGSRSIKLIYPEQSFWKYGNGQIVNLTLDIYVKTADGSETCLITRTIAVRKLYELSVKEENTYVRDGVDFDIEHLVSVYDYENATYLGEPTLDVADAIKVELAISTTYVITDEYTYTYDKGGVEATQVVKITDLNLNELMITRMSEDYTQVSSKIDAGSLEITTELIDAILEGLDIVYSDDGYSVEILVKAINKNTGDFASGIVSIHLDIVYDGSGNPSSFKANNTKNYIYLGKYQQIFDDLSITKEDYDFELYVKKNFTFASSEDDIVFAKTNDLAYVPATMKHIATMAGSSAMAELKAVTVLTVAVAENTKILLKVENTLTEYEVKKGRGDYYLVESNYVNQVVELFTGGYDYNGSKYTIASGTPDGIALNGFTKANIKVAKNIEKIVMTSGGEVTTNLTLSASLGLSVDSTTGIKYQGVGASITVKFKSTGVTYVDEGDVRVTLKYTGVDTTKAYVGTAKSKLIEIDSTDSAVLAINGGAAYVVRGSILLDIDRWSENMALVPGVGNTALIAKYLERDFSFKTNAENLEFTLEAVSGADGSSISNNLVEINSANQLVLKSDFNLTEYYVTIDIACKYPNSDDGDKLSIKESIGKVYISFKVV